MDINAQNCRADTLEAYWKAASLAARDAALNFKDSTGMARTATAFYIEWQKRLEYEAKMDAWIRQGGHL
jgi:hypothetical protein